MVSWPQSLPLCLAFSVMAGLCLVLSTTCLAVLKKQDADNKKEKQQKRYEWSLDSKIIDSKIIEEENEGGEEGNNVGPPPTEEPEPKKTWWVLGYFGNIMFQFLSFGFQTFSTFVGPVSIAVPVSLSAQLISNIVIFGVILKYETLTKDVLVGTLVDSVGVYLLIFVGATFPEEEPDILELLSTRRAWIWVSFILVCSAVAFPYHFLLGCSESSLVTKRHTWAFLMMSEVCNSILAASTLKMLVLVTGTDLVIVVLLTTYANGTLLYASMLRAVAVERQSVYLPIALTCYLGMTGLTGALVWEDEIQSKGGYICVFVLFGLAGFLLSEFELTSASNAHFKYGSVVEKGFSVIHRRSTVFNAKIKARAGISIAEMPEVYGRLSTMAPGAARNAQMARHELREAKSTSASLLAYMRSSRHSSRKNLSGQESDDLKQSKSPKDVEDVTSSNVEDVTSSHAEDVTASNDILE